MAAVYMVLALALVTTVRADPIEWTGAQDINAAGGNKVLSDAITLTGDAEINLFFGLEYLVVAGGGGGGGMGGTTGGAGGGGGGGLRKYVAGEADNSEDGLFVISPQSYAVYVGAGGEGGDDADSRGENGENSWFATIESLGGGGGGGRNTAGLAGGSGGGGGTQSTVNYAGGGGTADQGHKGGAAAGNIVTTWDRRGGGGGGAGGDGVDAVAAGQAGDGGPGLPTSITGTEVRLAGGGGGGSAGSDPDHVGKGADGGSDGGHGTAETPGLANTGGGGGGASRPGGTGPFYGADGGSGIVVVRYEGAEAAGGGTITYITEHAYGIDPAAYDAGVHGAIQHTVHAFTATGSHSFVASDLDLGRRLGATLSGSIGGDHGLTFAGPGTLALSGDNTYTGGTTVDAGVLRVDNAAGSGTGSGAVLIAAGAGLGGSGTISGDVTFAEGAKFLFDPSVTLTIDGTIVFEGTGENAFGVADLLADWSQVPNNTYILIEGVVDMNSLANVGAGDAYDLADGRQAYFLPGSLALEVIPEPGTLALLALAAVGLLSGRRARC